MKIFTLSLFSLLLIGCGKSYDENVTEIDNVPVYSQISDGYVGYNTLFEDIKETSKEQIVEFVENEEIDNGFLYTVVAPDEVDDTVRHRVVLYYKPETLESEDWENATNPVILADGRWGDRTFTETYELFRNRRVAEDDDIPDAYFNLLGAAYEE